jgi:hypothetical protein
MPFNSIPFGSLLGINGMRVPGRVELATAGTYDITKHFYIRRTIRIRYLTLRFLRDLTSALPAMHAEGVEFGPRCLAPGLGIVLRKFRTVLVIAIGRDPADDPPPDDDAN